VRIAPALLPLLLCALLAACSSAPSHYYVLSAMPQPPRPQPQSLAGTTVAIGAIRLPGALDRPQIARRIGPNQLDYSETERWAGPLGEMIRRVLAADLRPLLPPGTVLIASNSAAPANLAIAIDIARFDADKFGEVTLAADWEALGKDGVIIGTPANVQIVEPGAGSDPAAVAATMSRAVAALAARIAAGISPGAPTAAAG
jgi:uncharacterized protein